MKAREQLILLIGVIFLGLFLFTGNRNYKLEYKLNAKEEILNKFVETVKAERKQTLEYVTQAESIIEKLIEERDSLRNNQNKIKIDVKNNQEKSLQYIKLATSSIEQRDSFWTVESAIRDTIVSFPR
jgi:vacuolar-type H+-ATPase subunit I/STV1